MTRIACHTITIFALAVSALASQPKLVVSPRTLDFGERGHNETPSGTLTITNGGDAPLVVSRIKESCSCIKLSPTSLPALAPGASRKIRVSMGSGRAIGRLRKKITIESNDPRLPRYSISVGMRVLDGYAVSARELRFTGIRGGDPVRLTLDVTRARPSASPMKFAVRAVRVRYGRSKAKDFRTEFTPIETGVRLAVTLSPDHAEGRVQAELIASVDGKNLVIPLAGEVFAWILVEPTFLNFSNVVASDPASRVREFRLTSTDATPFRIIKAIPEPSKRDTGKVLPRVEINSSPSMKAHTIRLTIDGSPPADAARSSFFGKIRVLTDHPEKKELSVTYSGFFKRAR